MGKPTIVQAICAQHVCLPPASSPCMLHMSTTHPAPEGAATAPCRACTFFCSPQQTQCLSKLSSTHGQSPAKPEQLPGSARRVPHDKLNILATGQLGMLAEGLDDEVTEAAVRVDGALVDLDDRVGKLGGL